MFLIGVIAYKCYVFFFLWCSQWDVIRDVNFYTPVRCNKDFWSFLNITNISKISAVCELRFKIYGEAADSVTFGQFSDSQVEGVSTVMYLQKKHSWYLYYANCHWPQRHNFLSIFIISFLYEGRFFKFLRILLLYELDL